MVTRPRRTMFEQPFWPGPIFGSFGRVETDGDRIRCHVCGEYFHHLINHALPAHGLDADAYRGAFGLAQNTKLVGPTYRTKRIEVSGDHMRELAKEHGIRKGSLTTEERREQSLKAVRRVEHQLNSTEPERARFPLNARLGSDEGYPVEVLDGVRSGFRRRGSRGQRGVYARLGERWGVGWPTARSRVIAAVRRGRLDFDGKGTDSRVGIYRGSDRQLPHPGVSRTGWSCIGRGSLRPGRAMCRVGTVYQGVNWAWLDSAAGTGIDGGRSLRGRWRRWSRSRGGGGWRRIDLVGRMASGVQEVQVGKRQWGEAQVTLQRALARCGTGAAQGSR